MPAPNLGELTSMTQDYTENFLADNIFKGNVAWMKLKEKEKTFSGGEKIRQNLIYDEDATDQTGGSLTMGQTINHQSRPFADAAQFEWAEYYQEVVIHDREVHSNMGDAKIIDLMDTRMEWAQMVMRARFSRHLMSTAVGTENILGFRDLFSLTNTYGSLSRADNSWWQPIIHANAGTGRALTMRLMDTMYYAVSDGPTEPDLILTSDEVMGKYNSLLQANQRFSDPNLANAGFKNLLYKGIPMVSDKRMYADSTTRHHLYFLNFDHFSSRPHEQENMVMEEGGWRRSEYGKFSYVRFFWSGQVTCRACKWQGDLADIAPAL